jgi:DNA-binding response OmpR family regulator
MPTAARRILCAEANRDVSDLIALMLEEKGYQVTCVQTLVECLRVAALQQFDLCILNDTYDDGDSLELCEQLRKLYPMTPVLLFSLDTSGYHNRTGLDAGAHVYLTRTSDFVSLVQTIDRLLQSYSS